MTSMTFIALAPKIQEYLNGNDVFYGNYVNSEINLGMQMEIKI